MSGTLYWHDYETFGVDPRRDRPAQFAGVRTNELLQEVEEPLVVYCKPTRDVLPDPESCLITGITPQIAEERGVPEPEFAAQIHEQLAQTGTCSVGYNTLRFDDEVTRNLFYRNFYDPYAREWQNGNSRWDIIDLVRMTYALRPEGIEWPRHADGKPSFKLEDLVSANGISCGTAHEALTDVRATIALARLIRDRQPRLYDWLFQLRSKTKTSGQLDLVNRESVVHTSRVYPPETGCTTLVVPLVRERRNKNSVLVYDLRQDPTPFLELDVDALHDRLFTRTEELPAGVERLPVKSVKINKCPALAPRKTLTEAAAERIAIDLDACARHRELIGANKEFAQRIAQAYSSRTFGPAEDAELALYDGFLSESDRQKLARVRDSSPQALSSSGVEFEDKRMTELLFRYRARNWPKILSSEEMQRWERFRLGRLKGADGSSIAPLDEYYSRIADLRAEREPGSAGQKVLDELEEWGRELLPDSSVR